MKLSGAQIEQIVSYREAGKSAGWLARKYGVSISSIIYHCDRAGVVPPKGLRCNPARIVRGTAFTESELREMKKLSTAGYRAVAIARKIGRPYSSVRYRLERIALADELAS